MSEARPSPWPKVLYGLLALGVLVWWFGQRDGDEQRIGRQLDALREVIEKSGGEGDLEAVQRARQLGFFFARDFEVRGDPIGVLTDRQRLGQIMLQYRRQSETVGLGFRDQQLEILETGGRKVGEMEVVATLTGRTGADIRRESYRVAFLWVEEEGEWLLEVVELLEVLEGTPFF